MSLIYFGLGYDDAQEFIKDAVRRRLEEIWATFQLDKLQPTD